MNPSLPTTRTGRLSQSKERPANPLATGDGPDTGGNVTSLPDVPADSKQVTAIKHFMLPGSHEGMWGPTCNCGADWSRWDDCCARPTPQHSSQTRPEGNDHG